MCRGASDQVKRIDALARTRLSQHFILRDFLFSSHAAARGASNLPEDVEKVLNAGRDLCARILEPIRAEFGPFAITFGYLARNVLEADWSRSDRRNRRTSSNPHQWDRGTFGSKSYARVDLMPFCVEDGAVAKSLFGHWVMHNLDVDLLMQWTRSNVFCLTIAPEPRRVWIEWGRPSRGEPRRRIFMGTQYWQAIYPTLPNESRPRYAPSHTAGRIQWSTSRSVTSHE